MVLTETCCMILSGGAASRAGGINKSFLEVGGRSVLESQLESLRGLFNVKQVVVVTDRPGDYTRWGLTCVDDALDGGGKSAMRGLHAALSQCPMAWAFALGNDMPTPSGAVIRGLARIIEEDDALGACLVSAGGPEPLHAIYHRDLAHELAKRLEDASRCGEDAAAGLLSLRNWIEGRPEIIRAGAGQLEVEETELARAVANLNSTDAAAKLTHAGFKKS